MSSKRIGVLFLVAVTVVGCSGGGSGGSPSNSSGSGSTGGSTAASSTLLSAAPLFAIASPLAARTSTSATALRATRLRSNLGTASTPAAPAPPSLPDQIAAIKARLAQTTLQGCLAGINFTVQSRMTTCYGPPLAFLHHPDAIAGSPTGPAPSGCSPDVTGTGNGCLPSGDLGMWSATEATTGEACTSATMNAQVVAVSSLVNSALQFMAGLVCVAKVNGSDLSAGSAALDLTKTIAPYLQDANLTTASLQRLADQADGTKDFQLEVSGTVHGIPLLVQAKSSPGDSTMLGNLHGYLDLTDTMMNQTVRNAFSVVYEITAGTVRYEYRAGKTATTDTGLFTADGTFDFAAQTQRQAAPGLGGGTFERAQLDSASGLGTLVHAWAAGNGDQFTRVFQATTTAGTSGAADTGFGYFGFGPPLDSAALGGIVGMYCNWAGPGSVMHTWVNGVPNVNTQEVQGQTMRRDPGTGQFVPVVNRLTYAPTNSCSATATDIANGFVYEAYQMSAPTLADLQALAPQQQPVQPALVPYGDASIGTIPTIAAPHPYSGP